MNPNLNKLSDEVFIAADEVVQLGTDAVDLVCEYAARNARGRARICAHKSNDDLLHEMLIAMRATTYIRPHRHHGKSEAFHLVRGEADVVLLSDGGEIENLVELGAMKNFYYRLDTPRFHTLLIHSPLLVLHEITNGPFQPGGSEWAPFSPAEGTEEVSAYLDRLRSEAGAFKRRTGLRLGDSALHTP